MRSYNLTTPQELFLKTIYNKIAANSLAQKRESITPLSLAIVKTNTVYQYIPSTIQSWIQEHTHMQTTHKVDFTIAQRTVSIYLFGFSRYNEKKYQKMAHLIKSWLEIASQYAASHCAGHLDIYIYLTPFKKELPHPLDETRSPLDEININTASTTSCMAANSILIYRREEWFKVFIHETFHCMGLDFSDQNTTIVDKKILELYTGCDPSLDVRFYETYCETWATIINILYVMVYATRTLPTTIRTRGGSREKTHRRRQIIPKKWSIRQFMSSLNNERKYTIKQVAKILNYYRITYQQLIGLEEIESKYREKTQVFAYYILKLVIFFYMKEFWNWVEINQFSLNFPKTYAEESIHQFYQIIERNYNKKELIQELERVNPVDSPSMKMTLYGDILSK